MTDDTWHMASGQHRCWNLQLLRFGIDYCKIGPLLVRPKHPSWTKKPAFRRELGTQDSNLDAAILRRIRVTLD